MPELKIGLRLAALRLPFKKALQTASALGADGVEIDGRNELRAAEMTDTAVREVRKLLEDLRLRVAALRFPTRRGYDDPADLEARIEATKEAQRLAWRLGATVVVNDVGPVPRDANDPRWETLVSALTELGRHGQRVGALLAATTGADSGADLRRLLDALPEQTIGVDFDPAALTIRGHSVPDAIAVLRGAVLHVQARDAARDAALGRGLETPLGRGSVDFPLLLGALEEAGYRGHYTVARESTADPAADLGAAIQYLRAL